MRIQWWNEHLQLITILGKLILLCQFPWNLSIFLPFVLRVRLVPVRESKGWAESCMWTSLLPNDFRKAQWDMKYYVSMDVWPFGADCSTPKRKVMAMAGNTEAVSEACWFRYHYEERERKTREAALLATLACLSRGSWMWLLAWHGSPWKNKTDFSFLMSLFFKCNSWYTVAQYNVSNRFILV